MGAGRVTMFGRPPKNKETEYAKHAVTMLLYIECLPYALYDLRVSLGDRYKHNIKRRMTQCESISTNVSGHAYGIFRKIGVDLSRQYIDRMESLYRNIDSFVPHTCDKKYLTIVVALCMLIEQYNKKLADTFYYEHAEPIYKIPGLLDCIGRVDYAENIKRIIERQSKKV
ncbi:MAG: hypothetical protein RSF40_04950 [Oscillospiraceae bacterium]